jgi:hypothetical protein
MCHNRRACTLSDPPRLPQLEACGLNAGVPKLMFWQHVAPVQVIDVAECSWCVQ